MGCPSTPYKVSWRAIAEAKLTIGNVGILVMHDAESALPLEMTFPHVTARNWAPFEERRYWQAL